MAKCADKVIAPAPIIKKLADRCLVAKGMECSILGDVIDMLRSAPAVHNAPYWATEAAYKNGYEKGYEAGKPKWISTKERKPTVYDADKYRRVLVIEYGMIALANYLAPCNYPKEYPYWMPLTQPPRKEPPQITDQTMDALNKTGKAVHGGSNG